jgi:hypothetical protein
MGPGVLAGDLGLAVVVDEDVAGLDVAHLLAALVEERGRLEQVEAEVPELHVLEGLDRLVRAVVDLVPQQEGVVVVLDLRGRGRTLQTPFAPHSSVFLNS